MMLQDQFLHSTKQNIKGCTECQAGLQNGEKCLQLDNKRSRAEL